MTSDGVGKEHRNRRQISADTVRRRLRDAGIICRRPNIGQRLTRNLRRQRLQWSRQEMGCVMLAKCRVH